MTQQLLAPQTRAGAFDSVAQADRAIRGLLSAGFSSEQLAVICPAKFKEHFLPETPQAESPTANAEDVMLTGGIVGATLGGITLAALALTGGGAIVAAALLIGGGAIAGGFSNLIVSKGYQDEADDVFKQAIERGQIIVGVEILGENKEGRLADAQHILDEAGARQLLPM